MPRRPPLDTAALRKLRKVWAMRGSVHAGERSNAERLATQIVRPFGYALADVPALVRGGEPARPEQPHAPGQPGGFGNTESDRTEARASADDARKRQRANTPEQAEVLQRYGGLEAVLAWTERERLLRAAVARWSVFQGRPRPGWTKSIDGYEHAGHDKVSARVLRALSEAYPLPTSMSAAAAEFAAWQRRERDLRLVAEETRDLYLDMPAALRRDIVADLLQTGLPAASVADLLLRYRHMLDQSFMMREMEPVILADLERLAALEAKAAVQKGQAAPLSDRPNRTARERGAEVRRLLSAADTAALSDREIARRVGVSPQTVGNIRRRM